MDIAPSVSDEFEMKFFFVATMGNVSDITRQMVVAGSWHATSSLTLE